METGSVKCWLLHTWSDHCILELTVAVVTPQDIGKTTLQNDGEVVQKDCIPTEALPAVTDCWRT